MNAVVTDASVWVARFTPQEARHAACAEWLADFVKSGGQIVAPVLMLAEVCGAIGRRTGQPRLAQDIYAALVNAPEITFVEMDRALAQHAAQLAIDLRLRGADATYVALAHHLGVPLLSLDEEHEIRAGKMIDVIRA
jgi:predicted nucleic acid-binding protein